jgi:nitrate reductase cytochrome c-type subunit
MKPHKFIGTIIDHSYWEPYQIGNKTYRICLQCEKPKLIIDANGFCIGKHHYCEQNKNYWIDMAMSYYQGFIFIPNEEYRE